MTIRKATQSDIESLVPLYVAFFKEDDIATPPAAIRANLQAMLDDPRAAVFIAEDGGHVIGFSSGTLTRGVEFGCAAELEDLYVIPPKRGAGWARHLVAAVLAWASEQGATEVILVITPQAQRDQNLTAFYEKFGFKDSRRITMYRGPLGG
ncbi:GNAT family N-acetyltransferase [Rhodobacter capsulatus]|uniref:GNAT family N-acetyltransferase n=1 Tax=Rhodobacter capsulatus TaxID=1061 RepID=UPI0040296456